MNRLLEVIYYDYEKKPIAENPLATTETEKATSSFLNTYFSHMSSEEQDEAFTRLADLCSTIKENAFEVGFYAGVQLLTNREDF